MAAKGASTKDDILTKIKGIFPGAFSTDGKELRVDMIENGNPVQIKITLTAVKVPLSNSPESNILNEELFHITDEEATNLSDTLKEMGVSF